MEKIDEPDEVEQAYAEKLLKLDNNSLDDLYKLDTNELNNVLLKPQSEIQKYLIQAQIDVLKAKGEENLSDKEIDKYIALQEELITLKDSTIAVEKKETADNENLIAEEVSKQQVYNEVNSNLLSIKGSLASLQAKNEKVVDIFNLLKEADKFKV